MYNQQKGFLPLTTELLGLTILGYSYYVVFLEALSKLVSNYTLIDIAATIVATVVVLLFPTWFGLLLVKMFPSIRVVSSGIKYRTLGFIKGIIEWAEIEDRLFFENGFIAIAFQRRGFFLLNGTYFNRLYGILIRRQYAMLFLSPGTTNRDEILLAIHNSSKAKKLKKIITPHP